MRYFLALMFSILTSISSGSTAFSQQVKVGRDTSTLHMPLSNSQLLQIWEQYFYQPIAFYDAKQIEFFIPFCLSSTKITAQGTGEPLMSVKLVNILSAPADEDQNGFRNYIYLLNITPYRSNFSLTADNVYPKEKYDYLGVSLKIKDGVFANFTSSDDVFFGETVLFFVPERPIDPMKITYDEAMSFPAAQDSFSIAYGTANQRYCKIH